MKLKEMILEDRLLGAMVIEVIVIAVLNLWLYPALQTEHGRGAGYTLLGLTGGSAFFFALYCALGKADDRWPLGKSIILYFGVMSLFALCGLQVFGVVTLLEAGYDWQGVALLLLLFALFVTFVAHEANRTTWRSISQ